MIRHKGRWWYGTSCMGCELLPVARSPDEAAAMDGQNQYSTGASPEAWELRSLGVEKPGSWEARKLGSPGQGLFGGFLASGLPSSYCARRTVAGSVDAARRAGNQAAAIAVAVRVNATRTYVQGSRAST